MPVTSAMSRRTKTKTPTIQPTHSRTAGVTTLRSSSMVWRVKRPMVMNGLVMVFIPETMRRAGMESPSPAREQQGRGYGKSPLHARGRALTLPESPLHARGRAGPWPNACSPARNHPRMRGEEHCWADSPRHRMESPPHARGRGFLKSPVRYWCRITPACAGKSGFQKVFGGWALESPPHARGRGLLRQARLHLLGITPACAGKRVMKMRPPRA